MTSQTSSKTFISQPTLSQLEYAEQMLIMEVDHAESGYKHLREQLASEMRTFGQRLMNRAAELGTLNDPITPYAVNGLGEVQGRALDIDRKCALLQEKYEAFRNLEVLLQRVREQIEDAEAEFTFSVDAGE